MVQILGTGIQLKDILYIIILALFVYILALSAGNNDWNIPFTTYNVFNDVFFNGIEVTNTCGNMFEGLFTQSNLLETTGVLGILGSVGNIILTILGYLSSVLLLLYRMLIGCGIGVVRLAIGWIIIMYLLLKFITFIAFAKDIINR